MLSEPAQGEAVQGAAVQGTAMQGEPGPASQRLPTGRRLPSFRHRFEIPALCMSLFLITLGMALLLNIPLELNIDVAADDVRAVVNQFLIEVAVLAVLALVMVLGAAIFVGWRARRKLSYLSRGAVHVGPTQFPDLYAISEDCRQMFGVTKPTHVYVVDWVPSGTPSVLTRGFVLPPYYVVITTSQLNNRTPEELRFLLGREYGHILLGHVPVATIIDTVSGSLGRVPVLGGFIKWIFQGWTRLSNYSADRAGLIAVHHLDHVYSTLVKMIIGASNYERIDHSALAAQARHQRDYLHQEMILRLSAPFDTEPLGRFQELLRFARSPVYKAWRPEEMPEFRHREHWEKKPKHAAGQT